MKEPQQQLPMGLSIGVIVVFVTLVLGVCLLAVFLYNLPMIFPPPGSKSQALGLATAAPTPLTLNTMTSVLPAAPTPLPSSTVTSASPTAPTPTETSPSPTAPRSPVAAQARGHIVFVTERNGFDTIFIMNADGTSPRLLVPHRGDFYDYAPAISPDGRPIAFSSNGMQRLWSPSLGLRVTLSAFSEIFFQSRFRGNPAACDFAARDTSRADQALGIRNAPTQELSDLRNTYLPG